MKKINVTLSEDELERLLHENESVTWTEKDYEITISKEE